MALQVQHDTSSPGECEGDDSGMGFEEWLRTREILNETTTCLLRNGIDSKHVLAQCDEDIIKELRPSIVALQRIKLLGLISELRYLKITDETERGNGNKSKSEIEIKRIPVSDKEEQAILKMENKLKDIENKLSMNQDTNQRILQIKEECTKSIDAFFDNIHNVINERKRNLMDNVSTLIAKQENICNERNKCLQTKQNQIQELLSKCKHLFNDDANITIRKEKILQFANQDIFNDEEKTEYLDENILLNIKVDFQKPTQLIEVM